jgi:hypothetical protein
MVAAEHLSQSECAKVRYFSRKKPVKRGFLKKNIKLAFGGTFSVNATI